MNDLISIVVPCYNAERFLEPCLNSLLRQDYANFEIVCVDDGSTDSTLRILTAFAEQSDRVRITAQKHANLVAARHTGVAHARGEWVIFCDADDALAPCALSVLTAAAAPGVDFVRGGFTRCEADLPATAEACADEVPLVLSGDAFLRREMRVVGHRTVWGALFRRAILLTQIWDPSLRWTEDFATNIQAFLAARHCAELQTPLYFYRKNLHSITHAGRLDVFLRWRGSMRLIETILLENGKLPAWRYEWFHCLIHMELMHLITGVERFDYAKSEYAKTFARCFRQSPRLAVKALFAQRGILKLGGLLAFISGRLSVRTMLAYGNMRRRHLRKKGMLK